MSCSQRVASRYLRARFSLPEDYSFISGLKHGRIKITLLKGNWERPGTATANFEKYTVEDISKFNCGKEMVTLINQTPKLIDSEGDVRVVEVTFSQLREGHRGKGLGLLMYEKIIEEAFLANKNMPFLFIPNYCHRRSTTNEALRVWKSLARKYDNDGDVLAIKKA